MNTSAKTQEIRKFHPWDFNEFKARFGDYFRSDMKIDISEKGLHNVCSEIADAALNGPADLDLLVQNGTIAGFVIHQVDSPESDWCEREGHGCIREVYVASNLRRQGLGRLLVCHAEQVLWGLGVPEIYLTTDESDNFWKQMGYQTGGEVCAKNDGRIYVKKG